ncbi:TonB-dependent copper receptor [Acinetobacter qingfengensis]|uniref:TonB-dependent copper receptor n=1 Tax=Acinetobacter qingfengensis TaxID=1262585 RepID=A0A1E7R972_9GAMM|nr:TonB-dependent copper receptor [Acinetobacter qingfengensis]KAA8735478.1 TonB-dependent copper receptor [Acinetobacter qingfengensis]OEY95878.1 TonB-dependent copper receptor [Acinetobacter qingfengensis]
MNFYLKIQPLNAALCSLLWLQVSHAAESTQDTAIQLAPLVITAQTDHVVNGLMIVADPKQPIQPIPAADGAAYLKSMMGFNAVASSGINSDVTFRGMFGSRIKMLTDGTENLGACPSRMDNPASYISPESYDQITVIKGPQTVQYATPGSAATVMFERIAPKFEQGKMYQGQASIVMGSYGRLDQNIETALGNAEFYTRLNANRSRASDYEDGQDQRVHSSWLRWNTDLAFGWTPDADTWFELKAGVADGEAAYAGRSMDGTQFKRQSLGLHLEKSNLTSHIKKLQAQVDYNDNDHVMDNYQLRAAPIVTMMGMAIPNEMSMRVTRQTLNSRLVMTSEWNKWQVLTGIDSQHNRHGGDMKSSAMSTMNRDYTEDAKFQSYGAFTEFSHTFNPDNKLVSGIRLDHVKVDDLQTRQSRSENLPSAFIRLENQTEDRQIKNYIGLGYVERMPDYWELMRTSNRATTFNLLKPEQTLQLDLGHEIKSGPWNSWVSAYTGWINNYILIDYQSTSQKFSRNIDALIAGAEAGVGYQLNEQIHADMSAMYAWGDNRSDHTALPQIAPLEGRFNLRYQRDDFSLGLLWRMVAQQNRVSLNQGNIVGYDLNKSAGFSIISLNAAYSINAHVDVSMGIDNLFDKTYTEHLNKLGDAGAGMIATAQFNQPGRNVWARINMKF